MDETVQQHFTKSRPDGESARLIDLAVACMREHGRPAAEAFLRQHGIGWRVAIRVLSSPQYRRPPRPQVADGGMD